MSDSPRHPQDPEPGPDAGQTQPEPYRDPTAPVWSSEPTTPVPPWQPSATPQEPSPESSSPPPPPPSPYAQPQTPQPAPPAAPPYGGQGYPGTVGSQPGYPAPPPPGPGPAQPDEPAPYGQSPYDAGQPAYGQSPYGYATAGYSPYLTGTNEKNTSALVLLIVSIVSFFVCGGIFIIPAAVMGGMALSRQTSDPVRSRSLSRRGWIAYAIGMVVAVIAIGAFIAWAASHGTSGSSTGF